MRFRYTEIPNHQNPQEPFQRPYLIVRLVNGNKHKDVISLVDSGADVSLFHSNIRRMLAIDVQHGHQLIFLGVSGVRELAYLHRLDMAVRGLSPVSLEVGFANSMAAGTGLLGQRGFFEHFQIEFQLRQKFFEIRLTA